MTSSLPFSVPAHSQISPVELPKFHPSGPTRDYAPYLVDRAEGAVYARVEPHIESELIEVAREFGELVRLAILERFDIGPPRPYQTIIRAEYGQTAGEFAESRVSALVRRSVSIETGGDGPLLIIRGVGGSVGGPA